MEQGNIYLDCRISKLDREIRLLQFDLSAARTPKKNPDDSDSDVMTCTLIKHGLGNENKNPESKETFTALSYTWGASLKFSRRLAIGPKDIGISENLHGAMGAFVHHAAETGEHLPKLWVDFLCINQSDDDEKSWQVAQMREIYEAASEVMVWLGPGDSDSERAMQIIRNTGHHFAPSKLKAILDAAEDPEFKAHGSAIKMALSVLKQLDVLLSLIFGLPHKIFSRFFPPYGQTAIVRPDISELLKAIDANAGKVV
jgi:hypothetical protein